MYFSTLTETSLTDHFDCGEEELNQFLKNFALLFQQRHFGVTIICTEKSDPKKQVLGYYTLCPASIERNFLEKKTLTGPRSNPIPGFRLCRLAVDKNCKGKGYGKMLLIHCLEKCLMQSEQIGGSVLIIDAKNEKAKSFYEYYGFSSSPGSPLILVKTIKQIKKDFETTLRK